MFLMLFPGCAVVWSAAEPPPSDADELLKFVGEGFRIKQTDHFDIAYDTKYDIVRPLVGRLEGTCDAIQRFCRFRKLGRNDMPTGLRVILFDDFTKYTEMAAKLGIDTQSVAGFYSHAIKIAIFCNALHTPPLAALNEEMDRLTEKLSTLQRESGDDATNQRRELADRLTNLNNQRSGYVTQFNRIVIQHEAAHQILFNLGVHVYDADTPDWVLEGLACQFEVPQTHPQGRLRAVNHMRLADFREALAIAPEAAAIDDIEKSIRKSPAWMPLTKLLTAGGPNQTLKGGMAYYYGESWALVYYLHNRHRDAFDEYLNYLSRLTPGVASPAEAKLTAFKKYFGNDLSSLEHDWMAYMLHLRFDRKKAGR